MIIYANILITIVSEGFNEVKGKKNQFIFKDKCQVVVMCATIERQIALFNRLYRYIVKKITYVVYYITWKQT